MTSIVVVAVKDLNYLLRDTKVAKKCTQNGCHRTNKTKTNKPEIYAVQFLHLQRIFQEHELLESNFWSLSFINPLLMSDLETDCDKNKESFSPRTSAASFTTLLLLKKNDFFVKVFLQSETNNLS